MSAIVLLDQKDVQDAEPDSRDCKEEEDRKKSTDIPVLKSGKPVDGVDLNDTSKLWEM